MGQMQTISIRIPDEDFQWLLALQEPGAKTPSEKLRALVAQVRQQDMAKNDPDICSARMRSMAQPFIEAITSLERKTRVHSEVVSVVAERAPQLMATLVSSQLSSKQPEKEAKEVEAILVQQCFLLFKALLRSAVTSTPATYDNNVLDLYLPDIIELANIIANKKGKEIQNG